MVNKIIQFIQFVHAIIRDDIDKKNDDDNDDNMIEKVL
jgi:hypothetical protein